MQIITGKTGEQHVKSEDDRALHAGIIGTGEYVLSVGSKLTATIETANNISISDGELVFQGTHARIRHGESETCIIENGTTGYNRIDLIVARYTQSSGIEKMELAVIKGEATTGTPSEPEYTTGNILEGALLAEMPLYSVKIQGVNVISVTSKFAVLTTTMSNTYTKASVDSKISTVQSTLQKAIDTLESDTDDKLTKQKKELTARDNSIVSDLSTVQSTLQKEIDAFESGMDDRLTELTARDDSIVGDFNNALGNLERRVAALENK